jgi:hypothetical protein
MKLNQTNLGELYAALSPIEIKQLGSYLDEKPNDKVKKLHQWMVKLTKENRLKDCDTDFLIQKILGKNAIYSSYTTLANLLINHIKDYMILSKVKEKNIYTETLWGEILIERRLKRNLLLKITNFKLDLYNDSYALMKKFFFMRESFFYEYLQVTKKTYKILITTLGDQYKAFEDYSSFYKLETLIGYSTFITNEKSKIKLLSRDYDTIILEGINSEQDLIRMKALTLRLTLENEINDYNELFDLFRVNFDKFSNEHYVQLLSVLLNYTMKQVHKGYEYMYLETHKIFKFLLEKKAFFQNQIFSGARAFNLIRQELKFGSIENAELYLAESLILITPVQKESFQYLAESRIFFTKNDFNNSLRKISTINPSDSVHYYPLYKIMLIKNYIMLADIDRLMAERENFYKYLNNQKNIQEDEKRRHKLFIKYTEYLTNARYEYLTDYMKKRIENALLQTSPYFSEKQWVRERWEELKI